MTGTPPVPGSGASLPLFGKRIANTRSLEQASELDGLLVGSGAIPLSYPCIQVVPPVDATALDRAVLRLFDGSFDWLAFTSANAVRFVAEALSRVPGALPEAFWPALAAVGPGTARAVCAYLGLKVDLESKVQTAEALGAELMARGLGPVLLPLSQQAGEVLPAMLRAAGVQVTIVCAYRTVVGSGGVDLPELLHRGEVDAVTFTSPSTVDNFAVRLEREGGDWSDMRRTCVACIGPTTVEAAVRRGLRVQAWPQAHTLLGMVEALEAFFASGINGRSCE